MNRNARLIQGIQNLAVDEIGYTESGGRVTVYLKTVGGTVYTFSGGASSSSGSLQYADKLGILRVVAGVLYGESTTSHLPEGSQLYFTDARVYTAAKALLKEGSGITITADDGAQTLTVAATSSGPDLDTILTSDSGDVLVSDTGYVLVEG